MMALIFRRLIQMVLIMAVASLILFVIFDTDEFKKKIEQPGGFLLAHWDGTRETEDRIASDTKATIRCIPFERKKEEGKCMVSGKPSPGRVVFAKAY